MTLPSAAAWAEAGRRARTVAADWRDGAAVAQVRAAFAGRDPAAIDAIGDAALALLREPDWIVPLLAPLVAALAADPWFDPPLRVTRDRLRTTVRLLDLPAGTLAATVYDGAALAAPPAGATLVASGRLVLVRYHVAGGARLHRWYAGRADARFVAADATPLAARPARPLADGDVVRVDGRTHAHLLEGGGGEVVAITFTTRGSGLMREYDRASGRLRRAATTDEDESRTRMLLTLLRSEGRSDAAACFDAATHAPAFHLRWTAMREWLALDPGAALPRLRALARADPHPEVRALARATLPIVEAHSCRA